MSKRLILSFALTAALIFLTFTISLVAQRMPAPDQKNDDIAEQAKAIPEFRRGINLARLQSFAYRDPNQKGRYLWPPFQGEMSRFSDLELMQLTTLGFDFIRLPVDAGPFLAASDPDRRLLLDDLRAWVLRLLENNLTVMVDMHPANYASVWRPADILKEADSEAFTAYRDLLREVARRIRDLPPTQVALELMNEPQPTCKRSVGEDWTTSQLKLFNAVREVAPNLPIVLTGGCWSSIDGLTHLNPANYDEQTLFDIHFYEPHFFTHQSLAWASAPARHLAGLSYPWTNGSIERSNRLSRIHLDALEKAGQKQSENAFDEAAREVRSYYQQKRPDKAFMEKRFKVISDWAFNNGVTSNRIVIGEFGTTRLPDYIPDDGSRIAWYRDLRLTAEDYNFGWAVWDDHVGFGILKGRGNSEIDLEVSEALGLAVNRLKR